MIHSLHVLWIFIVLLALFTFFKTLFPRSFRTFEEMFPYLLDTDLDQVEDLMNPVDEGYLRLNMRLQDFRKAQRNRANLLRELLKRMSHNARYLQEWAGWELEKSWKNMNSNARDTSRELIKYCVTFRIATIVLRTKLSWWSIKMVVLSFSQVPLLAEARSTLGTDVLYTYGRIKLIAEKLGTACGAEYQEHLSEVL